MIALIPARGGSKRVPNKNIRILKDKALVRWTIDAAFESGVFSEVYVSTESDEVREVCYDVKDLHLIDRPPEFATDSSPDIKWVTHALEWVRGLGHRDGFCGPCSLGGNCMTLRDFAILRPTSPFRGPEIIQEAHEQWTKDRDVLDSLRAVAVAAEPAFKQWVRGPTPRRMSPVVQENHWHSLPSQVNPTCYIQTAALEMAWCKTVYDGTIAGERVGMFFTEGLEAFDINEPLDWDIATGIAETLR